MLEGFQQRSPLQDQLDVALSGVDSCTLLCYRATLLDECTCWHRSTSYLADPQLNQDNRLRSPCALTFKYQTTRYGRARAPPWLQNSLRICRALPP